MLDWNKFKDEAINSPIKNKEFVNWTDEWQTVTFNMTKEPICRWYKFTDGKNQRVEEGTEGAKSKYWLNTNNDKLCSFTYLQFKEFCAQLPNEVPEQLTLQVKIGIENGKPKIKFKKTEPLC